MLATAFAIPTELTSSFQLVSKRPAGACNFVEEEAEFGKGTKVIYRQVREREREREREDSLAAGMPPLTDRY